VEQGVSRMVDSQYATAVGRFTDSQYPTASVGSLTHLSNMVADTSLKFAVQFQRAAAAAAAAGLGSGGGLAGALIRNEVVALSPQLAQAQLCLFNCEGSQMRDDPTCALSKALMSKDFLPCCFMLFHALLFHALLACPADTHLLTCKSSHL